MASLESSYQVFRLPPGRLAIFADLEQSGFRFAECALTVGAALSPGSVNEHESTRDSQIQAIEANIERVRSFINAGLFTTDRVSLDSHFSKDQAANRYVNWLMDIHGSGGQVFEVTMDEKVAGFFTLEVKENQRSHGALNGLYPDSQGHGLGRQLHQAILREVGEMGLPHYTSQVSANNLPGLRAVLSAGMSIEDMDYIFVRHQSDNR